VGQFSAQFNTSLFESSDEAINYWFSSTDDLPNTRKMNRRYEVGYWNSDEIYRLYVKLLGNHSRIAEALGVYRTFAGKELTAAGLPSLQDPDMASIGGAIAAIQLGMSVEVACESNGVRQTDVEKLLKGDVAKLLRAIKEVRHFDLHENTNDLKAFREDMSESECI
jgi:hypothetical protein